MTSSNFPEPKPIQNFPEPKPTRTFYTSPLHTEPTQNSFQHRKNKNSSHVASQPQSFENFRHNFRQPNPSPKPHPIKSAPFKFELIKILKMSHQTLVSGSVDDVECMHNFFQEWMIRQEEVLNELQREITSPNSAESGTRLSELLDRVMSHYTEYYNAKSKVGQDNVFLLFSPTWLTPLERSFLWIGGFKPGLAFQILDRFVGPLSEELLVRIEELKEVTRVEEKELGDELARIQETVAVPRVVEMAKRAARAMDGVLLDLESALGSLRREMETLVECSDCLRFKTVMRVLSVLDVGQSVRFFMALTRFQVQIRHWGVQQEAALTH